ncbi:MAG: biopolymer transporter ExbD [Akkermansiaceae bacterium]|nr:biopolymer transporter ExbD [Akkermansiaceae bacterium]
MKKKLQSKKRRSVPVPIASMGDIAFLLIIFFMVCSEISKDKPVQLTLPWSEYVEKEEAEVVARVAMDEEGQIWLDGHPYDSPKDIEWGIRALTADTTSDEQRKVQFKADSNLTKEQFEPVLEAIAAGGGLLMAVGEEEPQ